MLHSLRKFRHLTWCIAWILQYSHCHVHINLTWVWSHGMRCVDFLYVIDTWLKLCLETFYKNIFQLVKSFPGNCFLSSIAYGNFINFANLTSSRYYYEVSKLNEVCIYKRMETSRQPKTVCLQTVCPTKLPTKRPRTILHPTTSSQINPIINPLYLLNPTPTTPPYQCSNAIPK